MHACMHVFLTLSFNFFCFCSKDDEAYEALDKYAFNQPTLHPLAYDEIKKRAIPPNVHCKLFRVVYSVIVK